MSTWIGPPAYADIIQSLVIINDTRCNDEPLGNTERPETASSQSEHSTSERRLGSDYLYVYAIIGLSVDQWATKRRR